MDNHACDGRRELRSVGKPARPILEISPKGGNRLKHNYKLPEFSSLFDKLPEDVKGVFRTGPFRHMLDIPRFHLNNRIIRHFMESVDNEFKSFNLGGRKVIFGPEDFAMSMGLGLKGRTVIWNGDCSSILRTKYREIDQKAPTLEGLGVLVMREIEGGGKKEDILRAFYAYTLASLIFSVRRGIYIGHWPLLDELEDVSKYAWGVAAYEFLREKLRNIPRNDHAERRLCGCTYMLQVLVLERGYAPSIPVEDAQKLPRMGRWSFLRLSGGMVEEILNTEPEKVIEQLKVEDWEVHFSIEMGVVSEQVTKKGIEADQMEKFHHECEVGSMSCSTAATRIGDSEDPVVTKLKRKLEVLESKMEWAEKEYGVDWSLYPKSGDLPKDSVDHSPGLVGRVKCDPRVRMPSSKCLSPFEQISWLPGQKCLSKYNDSNEKIEWVVRHQKYMPTRQEIMRLNTYVKNLSTKDEGDSIEVSSQQHLRVMDIREVMSPRGWVSDVFVYTYGDVLFSLSDHPVKMHRPIFLSPFIAHKLMTGYPKQKTTSLITGFKKSLSNLMKKHVISTENKLIFLPYCDSVHWMLMVADSINKTLTWLDSLNESSTVPKHATDLGTRLVTHVLCDWYEDVSSWPIVSVTVPIQKNNHDCALYMLSFMVSYAVTREIVNFTEEEAQNFRKRMLLEVLDGQLLPAYCK